MILILRLFTTIAVLALINPTEAGAVAAFAFALAQRPVTGPEELVKPPRAAAHKCCHCTTLCVCGCNQERPCHCQVIRTSAAGPAIPAAAEFRLAPRPVQTWPMSLPVSGRSC